MGAQSIAVAVFATLLAAPGANARPERGRAICQISTREGQALACSFAYAEPDVALADLERDEITVILTDRAIPDDALWTPRTLDAIAQGAFEAGVLAGYLEVVLQRTDKRWTAYARVHSRRVAESPASFELEAWDGEHLAGVVALRSGERVVFDAVLTRLDSATVPLAPQRKDGPAESYTAFWAAVHGARTSDRLPPRDAAPLDPRHPLFGAWPSVLKFVPKDRQVVRAWQSGDRALLDVRATLDGHRMRGKAHLVLQSGRWRILKEWFREEGGA